MRVPELTGPEQLHARCADLCEAKDWREQGVYRRPAQSPHHHRPRNGGPPMKRLLATVLVLLLLASPALAQVDKAIEVVPHDALGFILIKDLRQLSDIVDDHAKKINVPEYGLLL